MLNIEYELMLNEEGRPYVHLPDHYEDKPEDKFLAIELTRWFLQASYQTKREKYNQNALNELDRTVTVLTQIADEIAVIMWENMKVGGELDMIIDKNYHIEVEDLDELNKLSNEIVYNSKIYKKQDGLKCLIKDSDMIYIYKTDDWKILE